MVVVLGASASSRAAEVQCVGTDDTAAIQAAVNADATTIVVGSCAVRPSGITIPSDRTLDLTRATVTLLPGCVATLPYGCKALQTGVGAQRVRIIGGTIIGRPTDPIGIGIRIDSGHGISIDGTTLSGWRQDGVWIGGNQPSTDVRLSAVTIYGSGRNHISVTNATGIYAERLLLHDTVVGADPGGGFHVEPNGGELVEDVTVASSSSFNNGCGINIGAGKGRLGRRFKIVGNTLEDNRTYGLIFNSGTDAFIVSNRITGVLPPGAPSFGIVSIGGTPSALATGVDFSGNTLEANGSTRILQLAGVTRSAILGNTLVGAQWTQPALGTRGEMVFLWNEVR